VKRRREVKGMSALQGDEDAMHIDHLQQLSWDEISALLNQVHDAASGGSGQATDQPQLETIDGVNEDLVSAISLPDDPFAGFVEEDEELFVPVEQVHPFPKVREPSQSHVQAKLQTEKRSRAREDDEVEDYDEPRTHKNRINANRNQDPRSSSNAPRLVKNRIDPAPEGSLTFQEVLEILEDAHNGKLRDDVEQRIGVSPVNPSGPSFFYVAMRKEASRNHKIYTEVEMDKSHAVRLRSTKKLVWLSENRGLEYRELSSKERKTGKILNFGGCLYALSIRSSDGEIVTPDPGFQFLQIWRYEKGKIPPVGCTLTSMKVKDALSKDEKSRIRLRTADVKEELKRMENIGSSDEAPPTIGTPDGEENRFIKHARKRLHENGDIKTEENGILGKDIAPKGETESVLMELFDHWAKALDPVIFFHWTKKYSKYIMTEEFAKIVRVYVTQEDPRIAEDFLFPGDMLDELPIGVFKATMDPDVPVNGGTCVYSDDVFKEMVGENPVGRKGFFVSILSPLQRLCISRVWWKKMKEAGIHDERQYFSVWRTTQSSYTLKDGTVKVFRTMNRVSVENGLEIIECRSQDVSHLYPEIVALPPFLA